MGRHWIALVLLISLSPSGGAAQDSTTQQRRADLPDRLSEAQPSMFDTLLSRTTLGLGFDYNQGDFEAEQSTDTGAITTMVKLDWETISLRAALPFFGLKGPGTTELQGSEDTDYGVGDLTTSLT